MESSQSWNGFPNQQENLLLKQTITLHVFVRTAFFPLIPTTELAIIYPPHKAASFLFFFAKNLVKTKEKEINIKSFVLEGTLPVQMAKQHHIVQEIKMRESSRKTQWAPFSKQLCKSSEHLLSSECLFCVQLHIKSQDCNHTKETYSTNCVNQLGCRSALNKYTKSKLFFSFLNSIHPTYILGRPTNATILEMENISPRKTQKHKNSLKELTTETEHVLPVLTFLPLHRRILNFNTDSQTLPGYQADFLTGIRIHKATQHAKMMGNNFSDVSCSFSPRFWFTLKSTHVVSVLLRKILQSSTAKKCKKNSKATLQLLGDQGRNITC